ncbi:DNA alkylation repair protein [Aquimarina algiphila]|uniref:DNA alkylation repair protein n=1 Tax=Aquimarina algiphila TaxID=2047982 RepID=A0A554VKE1_9FLAO|nr:DNA alkylation repair protein [Aquimarina algiphila]TSE08503.1 DNA alkylation repair protein [Aquimarina algiphila]
MRVITKKSEIKELLQKCLLEYHSDGLTQCISKLNTLILSNKVKFPLLEYCAEEFYKEVPQNKQLSFCDKIQSLKTEGGNVILGIMLQKRLQENFTESISKATAYIADADIWYVCDIIGERVFGFALLHQPKSTISQIKKLSSHESNWVIRSLGAGIHYAIKKGLDKKNVKTVFTLLLSMANTKDKEIRQGVGWAAKTTAKFHPDIIKFYRHEIDNPNQVAHWFRTKISIGLNRNNYAKRN